MFLSHISIKMKIDVISREIIKPSSSTPSHLKNFNISFIDQLIPSSYFPIILHYEYDETTNTTQSQISSRLKDSLADVLTLFYPLAGKLSGDNYSVECDDSGVEYVETRVDLELKNIIDCPQVEVLDELLSYKLDGSKIISVELQLAVQVNFFNCGGFAIGLCINHKLSDVSSLTTFVRAWAVTSQGGNGNCLHTPLFKSSSLFPPQDLSSKRIPKRAPGEAVVTKRFVFTSSAIATLRARIAEESPGWIPPTRVEAISALIWKCCLEINELESYTAAFHTVNLRNRLMPPVPETTFGNIFLMAMAVTEGEAGLSLLAGKLRGSFEEISGDCLVELLGENGFGVLMKNFGEIGKLLSDGNLEFLRFSSWCKFRVCDADFGWGKPIWVSMGSTPLKGCVFFIDSSNDNGGIEVYLVLDEESMAKFELHPDLQSLTS